MRKLENLVCQIIGSVLLFSIVSCNQAQKISVSNDRSDSTILDANQDGKISPYEALDVLLMMEKEQGKPLLVEDFSKLAMNMEKEKEQEYAEMLEELDANEDGKVELKEVEGDMLMYAEAMDQNRDGTLTLEEMASFNYEDMMLMSEEDIKEEIDLLFKEEKATDVIELSKLSAEKKEAYKGLDANGDGKITRAEVSELMTADNTPVKFTVKGNTAFMSGVITAECPKTVLELLLEHPEVTIIEMINVPGSIDDVANLRAASYVRKSGLTTKLNSNSSVSSGGTDFFLAGKKRIVEEGARLGVHSWGGGAVAATEVPKDDPVHQKYLDFYKASGVPAAFYWYTLEAAPANGMHWMTAEEIETYQIRTQ